MHFIKLTIGGINWNILNVYKNDLIAFVLKTQKYKMEAFKHKA